MKSYAIKKCNNCKIEKPLSEYYGSWSGTKSICIKCYLKEQFTRRKRRTETERTRNLKIALKTHLKNDNKTLLTNSINRVLKLI